MLVNPLKLITGRFVPFNTDDNHSTGCYQYSNGMFDATTIFPFNGDHILWGQNDFGRSYPEFDFVEPYGVCDSPEQFKEKFGSLLENDCRPLVVMFTYVTKNPENKGKRGGWRWHKWGEYVGNGNPTTEYLDDEEEFKNGVYTYHIYMVDNMRYQLDQPSAGESVDLFHYLIQKEE